MSSGRLWTIVAVTAWTLTAISLPGHGAAAEDKPSHSITLVVPFARESRADLVARSLAKALAPALGNPVVVDNRPGFGGTVALAEQAKAPADNTTVLLVSESQAIAPGIRKTLAYDLLRDFDIVAPVAQLPGILVVNNDTPYKTAAELIAFARSHPQAVSYGSAGIGSIEHMTVELVRASGGVELRHVAYRKVAPMITDLLATFIQMAIVPADDVAAYIRAGNLRALAVTSAQRSVCFPDLPTLAEAGLSGYEATSWFGLAVRKGTRSDVEERLGQGTRTALHDPAVASLLAEHCAQPDDRSPDAFKTFIAGEIAKWGNLASQAGIKAD